MRARHREVPQPRARSKVIVSKSAEETERFGLRIARDLTIPCVILLRGALGTGKTTLARGLAVGLGVEDRSAINSPSFTLVNIYQGKCPIYHVDLYRVRGWRDLRSIGIDEFLAGTGVTIVEWSEHLPFKVPGALLIRLEDAGGDDRLLYLSRWPVNAMIPERLGKRKRTTRPRKVEVSTS